MRTPAGMIALALTFLATSALAQKPPEVAHPHLAMLKLRLAKFIPPGKDKELEDIELKYTVVADSEILRHKTIDFFVRQFAPAVATKAGLEPVAGMLETIAPIDSPDSARQAAERLSAISKKAIRAESDDKQKRLAVAQLTTTLRSIAKRAADERADAKLSAKQRYTRDSFEADKLGDDIQKIFRSTIDAGLDSEDDGLGALVETHLRELTAYATPEVKAQAVKKKKRKRRGRR